MGSEISRVAKRLIAEAWSRGDGPVFFVPNQGLCYINSLGGQSYLKEGIQMGIPAESPTVEAMLAKPLNGAEVVRETPEAAPADAFDYAPLQADLEALRQKYNIPFYVATFVVNAKARMLTHGPAEIILQLLMDTSMTLFPGHVNVQHVEGDLNTVIPGKKP